MGDASRGLTGATATRATTVLCVRKGGCVAMGADGQVTLGEVIVKNNADKLRRLHDGNVIAGFAGGTADAIALFELFEGKLDQYRGQILRAAVELAKEWRTSKILRNLQAMLCVADLEHSLLISGNGDVIEPEHPAVAVGSGAGYATAAARALLDGTDRPASEIVRQALRISADICIYTNHDIRIEQLSKQRPETRTE